MICRHRCRSSEIVPHS